MTVYANGLHLACKAQSNKIIAAFPDTCFTPPQTPATPPGVPVPYPSFGLDSDTDSGTGTVKVGGQTITHKNKSYYSKTSGTEAGCAPKKNLITSVNTGKEYAHAWSGNVKADKEPVSRFSDMCTNDHASPQAGSAPQFKVANAGLAAGGWTKCLTGSYSDIQDECASRTPAGETHHIVPDMVYRQTTRATTNTGNRVIGAPSLGGGMCICLTPGQHSGLHSSVNQKLAALPGTPAGTAPIARCAATGLAGLQNLNPKLHDDCIKEARSKVNTQIAAIKNKPGRTTLQPPAAGSPASNALRI